MNTAGIKLADLPPYVTAYKSQAAVDEQEALYQAKIAQPAFWQTIGVYRATAAARLNSGMGMDYFLWRLVGADVTPPNYRTVQAAPEAVFPVATVAEPVAELTDEEAARTMTQAEFIAWKERQSRDRLA